jgi:flagellar hook-basal body complex protein FliE
MSVNGVGGINTAIPSIFETNKPVKNDGDLIPFSDYLSDAMNKTNDLLLKSDRLTEDFAAGRTDNIHQVLIAAEKADIALQFTMQVRNKILDAYNEIMRMQI